MYKILVAAREYLKKNGVSSFKLDAELLLALALNITREELLTNKNLVLTAKQKKLFDKVLKRRANREPVSHIIGKREFWSNQFYVNKHVLDPRPDSEIIIETTLKLFSDKHAKLKILDLGTGSGCLILTLLKEMPQSSGYGVDISKRALNIAQKNAQDLGIVDRVKFIQDDFGKIFLKQKKKFDLIVCNPPYISTKDINLLEPEVRNHEPKLALDGGRYGLNNYINIAKYLPNLLKKNGFAIFEFGAGQHNDVQNIFVSNKLIFSTFAKDLTGRERCIVLTV